MHLPGKIGHQPIADSLNLNFNHNNTDKKYQLVHANNSKYHRFWLRLQNRCKGLSKALFINDRKPASNI